MKKPAAKTTEFPVTGDYPGLVGNIGELLESARRTSARTGNAIMQQFFVTYPGAFDIRPIANRRPLSWAHSTRLPRVENPIARKFYETESLRGGGTQRQFERQIPSPLYQRTAHSRNKTAMQAKGENAIP